MIGCCMLAMIGSVSSEERSKQVDGIYPLYSDSLYPCHNQPITSFTTIGYKARRVLFFTIQLFNQYRFQELNVVHHMNLSFGRGLCKDLEISAAASPQPIHVRAPSNHLRFVT